MIKVRVNNLGDKNLNFYKIKAKQENKLRQSIKMLSKDRQYKRMVQSRVFVSMLVNQTHGDVNKLRKQTESTRRSNYQNYMHRKCVSFYYKLFEELTDCLRFTNRGVLAMRDVLEYMRMILMEGERFKHEDALNIRSFLQRFEAMNKAKKAPGSGMKGSGGDEKGGQDVPIFFGGGNGKKGGEGEESAGDGKEGARDASEAKNGGDKTGEATESGVGGMLDGTGSEDKKFYNATERKIFADILNFITELEDGL